MSLSPSEWQKFDDYDWNQDLEFVDGLESILNTRSTASTVPISADERRVLEIRAKLFFYSRKIQKQAGYDDYIAWQSKNESLGQPSDQVGAGLLEASLAHHDHHDHDDHDGNRIVTQNDVTSNESNEPTIPYPLSFARIVQLITTGQEVPGIKQIPHIVLGEHAASAHELPQRRKPWER
ncbi:hypothetical protein V1514DRAFT_325880 [Lipomyces japonicus]|uniref:uncharacterized protein n=1 Tax=Lipomyces japonicus TaxID=56871 RepID=UPI0034CEC8F3